MDKKQNGLRFFGIGKVLPYLKKFRYQIFIMVFCGLLGSFVDIILPLFRQYALDNFVTKGTFEHIVGFIITYLLVIIFMGIVNYIAYSLATILEVSVNRDLRASAFKHLQTLSFSYFNQNSVGYIHARVMSDTSRIGSLVSWSLMGVIWHLTYIVGAIITMFIMDPSLTSWILLTIPVFVVLFSVFQKKLIAANREVREINSKITGNFNEGITGAKTVKALGIEKVMSDRFEKETAEMKKKSIGAAKIRGLFGASMNFASSIAVAIVLWKGGYISVDQVGTFSVFMSYAQGMIEPLRWLIDSISDLITTQVNIERFCGVLAVKSDVIDTPEVIEKYGDIFDAKRENWEELKGDIEFCDVTFRYPDGEENVLENFSLKVPFGTHLAIVGETGAGKSTLVNLVCRFYEPTTGKLLIDGRDARERSQLWLHSSIGYVLQTPHLFSGTVRENLLMGKPDATDEELWDAINKVSADTVVEHLEHGLDTDVGEGGDLLSTGEKQLISFARAVLADPKILILDEATASVDTITEAKIQSAMDSVTEGRTSLMIAHRLSTVKNADIILVVRDGKIVEQGSHKDLIKNKGYYYELYSRQYEDEATAQILS